MAQDQKNPEEILAELKESNAKAALEIERLKKEVEIAEEELQGMTEGKKVYREVLELEVGFKKAVAALDSMITRLQKQSAKGQKVLRLMSYMKADAEALGIPTTLKGLDDQGEDKGSV